MSSNDKGDNFHEFQDCLSASVIDKLSVKVGKPSKRRRSRGRKIPSEVPTAGSEDNNVELASESDPAELSDFVEYLAEEVWSTIPEELRTISYGEIKDDEALAKTYALPIDRDLVRSIVNRLPVSVSDSFTSYGLIDDEFDLERFLDPVLNSYVSIATAAPPEYTPELTKSRPDGCEICGREHLQLTYHHLIPRQIHAKAIKRGWHKEWQLNKVCWLCRACHSYVHRTATNEELAKNYYNVELLLEREDVQRWADWVRRIRWKAR